MLNNRVIPFAFAFLLLSPAAAIAADPSASDEAAAPEFLAFPAGLDEVVSGVHDYVLQRLATAPGAEAADGELKEYEAARSQGLQTLAVGALVRALKEQQYAAFLESQKTTDPPYSRSSAIFAASGLTMRTISAAASLSLLPDKNATDPLTWRQVEARLMAGIYAGKAYMFASESQSAYQDLQKGAQANVTLKQMFLYLSATEVYLDFVQRLLASPLSTEPGDVRVAASLIESEAVERRDLARTEKDLGGPYIAAMETLMDKALEKKYPFLALGGYFLYEEQRIGLEVQKNIMRGASVETSLAYQEAVRLYHALAADHPDDFLGLMILDRYQQAVTLPGKTELGQPSVGSLYFVEQAFRLYGDLGMVPRDESVHLGFWQWAGLGALTLAGVGVALGLGAGARRSRSGQS